MQQTKAAGQQAIETGKGLMAAESVDEDPDCDNSMIYVGVIPNIDKNEPSKSKAIFSSSDGDNSAARPSIAGTRQGGPIINPLPF